MRVQRRRPSIDACERRRRPAVANVRSRVAYACAPHRCLAVMRSAIEADQSASHETILVSCQGLLRLNSLTNPEPGNLDDLAPSVRPSLTPLAPPQPCQTTRPSAMFARKLAPTARDQHVVLLQASQDCWGPPAPEFSWGGVGGISFGGQKKRQIGIAWLRLSAQRAGSKLA
jgi:hypothetical protein